MGDTQLESVVFEFEEALPGLDLLPIAARRALDHAGLRLSLQGWRSLVLEDRRRVVMAGADEVVDVARVASAVRRATPPSQVVDPVGDPDPLVPPAPLVTKNEPARWIDPSSWSRLRALDRYALAHEHRRAIARNDPERFVVAFEAIVGERDEEPRPPSEPPPDRTPPPYDSFGRYSSMVPDPMPHPRTPPGGMQVRARTPAPHVWGPAPRDDRDESSVPPPPPARKPASAAEPQARRRQSVPPAPRLPVMAPEHDEPTPVMSTHVLPSGEVHMVDVRPKMATARRAVACGIVQMRPETAQRVLKRDTAKGEVLATARIAGIMAAKRTPDLIPLCHSVSLTTVTVDIAMDPAGRALVTAVAEAYDRTGVEMEALIAVSMACLTLYDMLKGVDREMVIEEVKLLEKSGGRSGDFKRGPSKK